MEQTINQDQPVSQSPASNPPPVSPANKSSFPLILVVLVIILIGLGSFFLGKSLSSPKISQPPISKISPTPVNTATTPNQIAGWKTVEITNYKISFKLPSGWGIVTNMEQNTFIPITDDTMKQTGNLFHIREGVNSTDFLSVDIEAVGKFKFIKNGNNPLFDRIISTFRPLDSTQSTPTIPADWKTYRNETLGFEIKYPNDWRNEVYVSDKEKITRLSFHKIFSPPIEGERISGISVTVTNNLQKLSLVDWLKDDKNMSNFWRIETQKPVAYSFNGYNVFKILDKDPSGKYNVTLFLEHKGYIFRIDKTGGWGARETESVFESILSTFKFLP